MRLSIDQRWLRIMRHDIVTDPGPLLPFPLQCPHCQADAGFPCYASTIRGLSDTIRLGLRCRGCQGEWTVQLRSSQGALRVIGDNAATT